GSAPAAPAPVQDNPDAADLAAQDAALPPSAAAGNYAVNFGAYASQADADQVIARLKQSQLPGFSEPAQIGGRAAWRVRIGPYASQAQAEAVRLQAVKVRSDVNAQVVTLDAKPVAPAPAPAQAKPLPAEPAREVAASKPVEAPKPAPAKPESKPEPKSEPAKSQPSRPVPPATPSVPAASNVGFAVQLGAFGRVEDANALRDKVRAAGFSAFVEQVRTDKGTLNRVRVGPVANRGDAEQLKAQVAAKVGVSGMVRPHP
ncbi:MAG: SPOR domain-containing protein, partial [Pseudomonas sp.]